WAARRAPSREISTTAEPASAALAADGAGAGGLACSSRRLLSSSSAGRWANPTESDEFDIDAIMANLREEDLTKPPRIERSRQEKRSKKDGSRSVFGRTTENFSRTESADTAIVPRLRVNPKHQGCLGP
ncbi:MAG: hypothetical protein K2W93_17475, partial [Burkholderiaceae bacterium]|nr:hypothetical protein [Burkholderiaceae bacterium]